MAHPEGERFEGLLKPAVTLVPVDHVPDNRTASNEDLLHMLLPVIGKTIEDLMQGSGLEIPGLKEEESLSKGSFGPLNISVPRLQAALAVLGTGVRAEFIDNNSEDRRAKVWRPDADVSIPNQWHAGDHAVIRLALFFRSLMGVEAAGNNLDDSDKAAFELLQAELKNAEASRSAVAVIFLAILRGKAAVDSALLLNPKKMREGSLMDCEGRQDFAGPLMAWFSVMILAIYRALTGFGDRVVVNDSDPTSCGLRTINLNPYLRADGRPLMSHRHAVGVLACFEPQLVARLMLLGLFNETSSSYEHCMTMLRLDEYTRDKLGRESVAVNFTVPAVDTVLPGANKATVGLDALERVARRQRPRNPRVGALVTPWGPVSTAEPSLWDEAEVVAVVRPAQGDYYEEPEAEPEAQAEADALPVWEDAEDLARADALWEANPLGVTEPTLPVAGAVLQLDSYVPVACHLLNDPGVAHDLAVIVTPEMVKRLCRAVDEAILRGVRACPGLAYLAEGRYSAVDRRRFVSALIALLRALYDRRDSPCPLRGVLATAESMLHVLATAPVLSEHRHPNLLGGQSTELIPRLSALWTPALDGPELITERERYEHEVAADAIKQQVEDIAHRTPDLGADRGSFKFAQLVAIGVKLARDFLAQCAVPVGGLHEFNATAHKRVRILRIQEALSQLCAEFKTSAPGLSPKCVQLLQNSSFCKMLIHVARPVPPQPGGSSATSQDVAIHATARAIHASFDRFCAQTQGEHTVHTLFTALQHTWQLHSERLDLMDDYELNAGPAPAGAASTAGGPDAPAGALGHITELDRPEDEDDIDDSASVGSVVSLASRVSRATSTASGRGEGEESAAKQGFDPLARPVVFPLEKIQQIKGEPGFEERLQRYQFSTGNGADTFVLELANAELASAGPSLDSFKGLTLRWVGPGPAPHAPAAGGAGASGDVGAGGVRVTVAGGADKRPPRHVYSLCLLVLDPSFPPHRDSELAEDIRSRVEMLRHMGPRGGGYAWPQQWADLDTHAGYAGIVGPAFGRATNLVEGYLLAQAARDPHTKELARLPVAGTLRAIQRLKDSSDPNNLAVNINTIMLELAQAGLVVRDMPARAKVLISGVFSVAALLDLDRCPLRVALGTFVVDMDKIRKLTERTVGSNRVALEAHVRRDLLRAARGLEAARRAMLDKMLPPPPPAGDDHDDSEAPGLGNAPGSSGALPAHVGGDGNAGGSSSAPGAPDSADSEESESDDSDDKGAGAVRAPDSDSPGAAEDTAPAVNGDDGDDDAADFEGVREFNAEADLVFLETFRKALVGGAGAPTATAAADSPVGAVDEEQSASIPATEHHAAAAAAARAQQAPSLQQLAVARPRVPIASVATRRRQSERLEAIRRQKAAKAAAEARAVVAATAASAAALRPAVKPVAPSLERKDSRAILIETNKARADVVRGERKEMEAMRLEALEQERVEKAAAVGRVTGRAPAATAPAPTQAPGAPPPRRLSIAGGDRSAGVGPRRRSLSAGSAAEGEGEEAATAPAEASDAAPARRLPPSESGGPSPPVANTRTLRPKSETVGFALPAEARELEPASAARATARPKPLGLPAGKPPVGSAASRKPPVPAPGTGAAGRQRAGSASVPAGAMPQPEPAPVPAPVPAAAAGTSADAAVAVAPAPVVTKRQPPREQAIHVHPSADDRLVELVRELVHLVTRGDSGNTPSPVLMVRCLYMLGEAGAHIGDRRRLVAAIAAFVNSLPRGLSFDDVLEAVRAFARAHRGTAHDFLTRAWVAPTEAAFVEFIGRGAAPSPAAPSESTSAPSAAAPSPAVRRLRGYRNHGALARELFALLAKMDRHMQQLAEPRANQTWAASLAAPTTLPPALVA